MLYFDGVSVLSYNHKPVLLDAGLRYRVEKTMTINGFLRTLTNSQGVSPLITKENLIIDGAQDYQQIILNGIDFGVGYITNIDFAGGEMVRNEKYTYEIVCYENGNLFNATGGVYAGITWANANLIENIEESFSYEENENGDKTYNHSIAVRYSEYSSTTAGINLAKVLATEFFNATSGLSIYINSYVGLGNVKKIYNENYNLIDCSCSWDESVTILANSSSHYSYDLLYSVEQDEAGYVSVSETINIKGLTSPKYPGAVEGLNALKAGAYSRANTIYQYYNFASAPLYPQPLQKGVSTNKFQGTIDYKTIYSNNPKYQNYAIWSYESELVLDENNYYEISERGSIIGMGRPLVEKYTNAINFYNTNVKTPTVDARIATLYASTGRSNTLYLKSHSFSKDEFKGVIQYSITKTDNNTIGTNSNIKSSIINVETSQPVHLVKNYNIFNLKELVQTQNQSTLGQRKISINLRGKRGLSLATYLTEAKALAVPYIPSQTDKYIESAPYNWEPQNNAFSIDISYIFVGNYKLRDDLTIDLP
jgi:hypothetical protein